MTHLQRKMKRIHFVGIGGIGMSGIAELLAAQGFKITGSDLSSSPITQHLEECGCEVSRGHKAGAVRGANAVVYSSAVNSDNPELIEAKRLGIPVIPRAEMLAELMRLKIGIAVAGTHGKTTTTSLIGHILTAAGVDPTVIVGGVMRGLGTNARIGEGELLVAEADEYDRSFLKLTPTLAVITNLEEEHLDTYGTFAELRKAFIRFADSVPFYGAVTLCNDDPNLVDLISEISRPIRTYGFNPHADLYGEQLTIGLKSGCTVFESGEKLGEIQVPLAGKHNLANALGAVAVARELDVSFEIIRDSLKTFSGVKRRLELRGKTLNGIEIYDDYAHHPTEVRMTLTAARSLARGRLVAVFQPHLYSRTQRFYQDFAKALMESDLLIVTDVYRARGALIDGVSGELIVEQARGYGHRMVHYIPERVEIAPYLVTLLEDGDMVITLGAGDISRTSDELLELLNVEAKNG